MHFNRDEIVLTMGGLQSEKRGEVSRRHSTQVMSLLKTEEKQDGLTMGKGRIIN